MEYGAFGCSGTPAMSVEARIAGAELVRNAMSKGWFRVGGGFRGTGQGPSRVLTRLRVTLYVVFTIGCFFEPLCGSGSGSLVRGWFRLLITGLERDPR